MRIKHLYKKGVKYTEFGQDFHFFGKKNQITDFFADRRSVFESRENCSFNIKVRSLSKAHFSYVVKTHYMVFILAASSLHHAMKTLPQALVDH